MSDLLRRIQDQVASFKAHGKVPRTIILAPQDYEKLPKHATQLFGLNVVRADNYPETVISAGVFEKVHLDVNTRKILHEKPKIEIVK